MEDDPLFLPRDRAWGVRLSNRPKEVLRKIGGEEPRSAVIEPLRRGNEFAIPDAQGSGKNPIWIGAFRVGVRFFRMKMPRFTASIPQIRIDTLFSNPTGWGRINGDPYILCFVLTGFGPPRLMSDPGHTHVGSPVFEGRVMG